jgi:Uma2 family endonuclease
MTQVALPETPALLAPTGPVDSLYEVIDGQRVELPPMGVFATSIASEVLFRLSVFVREQKLGWVDGEMLFELPRVSRQRRPDVSYVSYSRWPRNKPLPRAASWLVAPDLAVEVVSPTDLAVALVDKVHEYFQAGVRGVWVVWPNVQQVYVYQSPVEVAVVPATGVLSGADILPGFQLPVASLFEERVEQPAPGDANGAPAT